MADHVVEGLSFLLPICNQAGHLELVMASWSTLLERLDRPYEILVIDDGSTDSTQKLIEGVDGRAGLAKRIPHVRVITHSERRGFGACVREGIEASRFPLVFYTGCDFTYNPADLRKMLPRLEDVEPVTGQKVGAVTGYRAAYPLTGWPKLRNRLWRIFMRIVLGMNLPAPTGWPGEIERRFAFWTRVFFGLRVEDVNSKFKLFRKSIFARIPIQSDGDFVHGEILSKANFLSIPVAEIPIAENPGPFPAHPEPPPRHSRGSEMRRVFFSPDFGPLPKPAGVSPAAIPQ